MVLRKAELLQALDGLALVEPAKTSCRNTMAIARGTQPLETRLIVSVELGLGGLARTCLVEADEGERALNRPGMVQAKGEPRGCNTPV